MEVEQRRSRVAAAPARRVTFLHDSVIAAVMLIPTWILLDFGGGKLRGIAAAGVLITYIFHALALSESSFACAWLTLAIEIFGHIWRALTTFGFGARGLGLACVATTHITLLGAWVSVHQSWLITDHIDVAVLCERLLFNVAALTSSAIVTWGVGAIWGAALTPSALLLSLAASYCLIGTASPSSFDVDARFMPRSKTSPHQHPYAARDEAGANALAVAVVTLPSLYYGVLHSPSLTTHMTHHLGALRTLLCAGMLLVTLVPPSSAAPWARLKMTGHGHGRAVAHAVAAGRDDTAYGHAGNVRSVRGDGGEHSTEQSEDQKIGALGSAIAVSATFGLACATHGAAVQWAATSGSAIIDIAQPLGPPLLAVALSGPIVLGVVLGLWPRRVPAAFAPTLLGLSLMSMVYLLGLSRLHIFASLAAALFGLSAARKRSAPLALACSTCVTVLAHGVLQRTTGFVAHEFDAVGLSLQSLTALLVGMTALCGSAVAFSLLHGSPSTRRLSGTMLGGCLLAHALSLALLEAALINEAGAGGAPVYPPPFVCATVILGILLCSLLAERMPMMLWSLLLAAHLSRLHLLVVSSIWRYADAFALTATLAQAALSSTEDPSSPHSSQSIWTGGIAHLVMLALATWRGHAVLFPPLISMIYQTPQPPRASLLGGSIAIFSTAARCMMLQYLPPNLTPPSRRAYISRLFVWAVAAGAALAIIQPVLDPLLLMESIAWTLFHPTASFTYGGTPRLLLWPPWLLYALLLMLIAIMLGLVPVVSLSPAVKLGACGSFGVGIALTAAGTLLPLERTLFLLLATASGLGSAFLALCVWPSSLVKSPRAPASLLAVLLSLFPVGIAIQSHVFHHATASRGFGAPTLYRAAWSASYAGILATGALLCRMHAGKAVPNAMGRDGSCGVTAAAAPTPLARSSVALRAEAYEQRQSRRRAGLEWVGGVGNVCACSSAAFCIWINHTLLGGTSRAIVPISPLLLLLHPHTPPFTLLHTANRYAPIVSAIACVLTGAALAQVGERITDAGIGFAALRGFALILCTIPALVLCCRFLWDGRQINTTLMWCAAPLPSVPMLLSHDRPIYDLGLAGLLAAGLHFGLARRARRVGLKYL